jgi:hypothetical protein
VPDESWTAASKILKPGRLVERRPQTWILPAMDAVCPGLSDAMVAKRLRSSYRSGKR